MAGPELTVDLATPGQMFQAPPLDPMAPGFALASGVERILGAAEALSEVERGRGRILVRIPCADAGVAAALSEGLRRYLSARRADKVMRQAALRREGLQTLWLALGIIVLCVLLSLLLELVPGEGLFQTLLRDGLVVGGWVALWRPLDLLVFETWLLRRDKRILDAVARMPLQVQAAAVS